MASSVARMPSDEWRHHHPSRLLIRTHNSLAKVLTRISTSINPSAAAAASAVGSGGEPLSPATASKRRQSQILDRWVARQAREMITTIERQTHEAELSALSTTTQPVSARAASFLRETSPDSSVDPAAPAVAGSRVVAADIPPTVRASSLIQMWRELEAEAVVCPTPRTNMTGAPATAAVEDSSGSSETCDEAEALCEWENAEAPSSASSSAPETEITERRKVGDIVRMLSLQISSSIYESDLTAKEVTGNAPATVFSSSSMPKTSGKTLRLWRRREMDDFISKLGKERRREVAALGERHPVSRFPFRGRIQSLIRLRSLRQEVATIRHQQRSQKLEMERFETPSNNFFARQKPDDINKHDINEIPNEESSTAMKAQPLDSDVSAFGIPINLSESKNNHFSELVSVREIDSSPQAFYTPQAFFTPLSRYKDLRESQSSDASWDERSLWGSSLDWQRPSDCHMPQSCHGEVLSEGTETPAQQQHMESVECNWLSQPSNSRRRWSVIRKTFCNDVLNSNFNENGELQELLEMRTVSTSLASEFATKMNQMIASFLHRQGKQYAHLNGSEKCEEHSEQEGVGTSLEQLSPAILHNQEIRQNTSLLLSSQMLQNQESWQSISLPLPSHILQGQNGWKNSSFTQSSSSSAQEGEDMHDLKYSVAQIHHEISELRKLVESCLDWQKKLGHSIKEEVFSAINQLAERGNLSNNSKSRQGRKDSCCICCEAQVDTLLYRCGHMCACYKCAQELQWSSGRCPICRSLIADVIRAYPNS